MPIPPTCAAKVSGGAARTDRQVDSIGPAPALEEAKDIAKRADPGPVSALQRRVAVARAEALNAAVPPPPALPPVEVSAVDAIRALGGALRLIDGLVPGRFELSGRVVRVHYVTVVGAVVLEQWREGDAVRTRLTAGPGVPGDSIAAWSRRVM